MLIYRINVSCFEKFIMFNYQILQQMLFMLHLNLPVLSDHSLENKKWSPYKGDISIQVQSL